MTKWRRLDRLTAVEDWKSSKISTGMELPALPSTSDSPFRDGGRRRRCAAGGTPAALTFIVRHNSHGLSLVDNPSRASRNDPCGGFGSFETVQVFSCTIQLCFMQINPSLALSNDPFGGFETLDTNHYLPCTFECSLRCLSYD